MRNEANDSADIQILISQPIATPEAAALNNCAWVPKNTAGSYGEKNRNWRVLDKVIRYAVFTILTHLRLLHLVSYLIYLSRDDGYG
jgi:hypothetical protein